MNTAIGGGDMYMVKHGCKIFFEIGKTGTRNNHFSPNSVVNTWGSCGKGSACPGFAW